MESTLSTKKVNFLLGIKKINFIFKESATNYQSQHIIALIFIFVSLSLYFFAILFVNEKDKQQANKRSYRDYVILGSFKSGV